MGNTTNKQESANSNKKDQNQPNPTSPPVIKKPKTRESKQQIQAIVNKNLVKIETKCKMQIISMYVEKFLSRTVNSQPTYIVKVQVLQCGGPTTFIHMKFLKNSEQDEFLLGDVLLEQDVSSPIELF